MKYFTMVFFLAASLQLTAQKVNIVPALKLIQQGKAASAKDSLKVYQQINRNDPDVLFLDAILTSDGEMALEKYRVYYKNFPGSRFADLALYRIFSYYFARGLYTKAESYLSLLKKHYPGSKYIKHADRNIPDERKIPDEKNIAERIPEKQKRVERKPVPEVRPQGKFTVQAGAFHNRGNAENLAAKFRGAGYTSNITEKDVAGSHFNVVMVGSFGEREEAEKFLDRIADKFNISGRVIPLVN